MKKLLIILAFCFVGLNQLTAQLLNRDGFSKWQGTMGVNINLNSPIPPSALVMLGDSATSKALLLPRVQHLTDVALPRQGMFIYCLDSQRIYYRDLTRWVPNWDTTQLSLYYIRQTQASNLDSTNVIAVKNVSDLKSTSYHVVTSKKKNSNDRIKITLGGYYDFGDGGGGDFYWDPTSTAAEDSGTVFQVTDVVTGRWKRILPKREVNLLWFGAKADYVYLGSYTDNLPALRRATKALSTIIPNGATTSQMNGELYIPGGSYYFSDTFIDSTGLNIKGSAGNGFYTETVLVFPINTVGIKIVGPSIPNNKKASGGTVIQQIWLESYPGSTDTLAHGFEIHSMATFDRCVTNQFGGNGFHLEADAADLNSPIFGNTAFCILERCRSQFCNNGFYTAGGESNVILFNTCDATANRRWGYWENGFLGNTYINCHAADNTYSTGTMSQVTVGTKKYICVVTNVGIKPGVTAGWQNYWVDVGNPFSTYFQPWDTTTKWYSGGAYNSYPGLNNNNMFLNCYQEGGQPSMWGARTMVMGGDLGAALLPEGYGDMRMAASGSNYTFYTGFEYNNTRYGETRTLINGDGVQLFPHPTQSNSANPLRLKYDTTQHKFILEYANSSFKSIEVASTLADASDFGLSSLKLGIPSFPQGLFINRIVGGNKRLFSFGTTVPVSEEYSSGDFILNANSAASKVFGWKNILTGTPGTWDTLGYVPGGGDSSYVLTKNSNTPFDYSWKANAGGGGGSGTVNSGTQYQLGYYATTGTAISGNSGITTNANNKLSVSSSDAEPLTVNTTNTSGISGSGFYVIRLGASGMTNGQIMQYMFGKDDNTNNRASFDYHHTGASSTGNFVGFGFYGNNDLSRLYATGNFSVGYSSDLGEKFAVNGNAHIGSRFSAGTGYFGGLASPVASALVEFNSTTKGVLIPKVTTTQMNAISTPATGLMVINTDTIGTSVGSGLFMYDGTAWRGIKFSRQDATGGLDDVLSVNQALTASRTASVGSNVLKFTGNPAANGTIWAEHTGSQVGLFASNSGTGGAIFAQSIGAAAIHSERTNAGTNDVVEVANDTRWSTGTAANGFGSKNTRSLEASDGNAYPASEDISKWANATAGSRAVQRIFTGTINATVDNMLAMGDYVTLTESTATIFTTTTIPTGKIGGGEVVVTIEANDATDFQSRTQRFLWTAVNKAGTLTITISTPEEIVAASTGTLTSTITAVDGGGGALQFKANAVSSLTQTTLRATYQITKNF